MSNLATKRRYRDAASLYSSILKVSVHHDQLRVLLLQALISNITGSAFALVHGSLVDAQFLNCRPSVVAAAIIYAERRSRGVIPFWPSMLAKLTGYVDMSTPELSVAIKVAQQLCNRLSPFQSPAAASAVKQLSF